MPENNNETLVTRPAKERKRYVPPAIEAEDDLSAEGLLHFAPSGPRPSAETCGFECSG